MRGYLAWDDEHLDNDLSVEFRYTQAYRDCSDRGLAARELECLRIALPAAVAPPQEEDLLAGRRVFRPLGVAPSYWDDDTDGLDNVAFYADLGRLERVMNRPSQTEETRVAIAGLINFWKKENVNAKVRAKFDPVMKREMPSDLWSVDSGVIFGLYRLVFSQLDYDKLICLGLPGLREEVLNRLKDETLSADQREFLLALVGLTDLMTEILGIYEEQFRQRLAEGRDPERNLQRGKIPCRIPTWTESADWLCLRGWLGPELLRRLSRSRIQRDDSGLPAAHLDPERHSCFRRSSAGFHGSNRTDRKRCFESWRTMIRSGRWSRRWRWMCLKRNRFRKIRRCATGKISHVSVRIRHQKIIWKTGHYEKNRILFSGRRRAGSWQPAGGEGI